jgi:hypothetical protein
MLIMGCSRSTGLQRDSAEVPQDSGPLPHILAFDHVVELRLTLRNAYDKHHVLARPA